MVDIVEIAEMARMAKNTNWKSVIIFYSNASFEIILELFVIFLRLLYFKQQFKNYL